MAMEITNIQEKHIRSKELNEDLLLVIMSWLPAKSIFRFKSISNFFLHEFSSLQIFFALEQSHNSQDTSFFIRPKYFNKNNVEFHPLPNQKLSSGLPLNSLQFLHNNNQTLILESSNGLLLMRDESTLLLCNPATQTWLPIPTLEPDMNTLDFVFECKHSSILDLDDYILMSIKRDWARSLECKLYLPKEKKWKTIGNLYKGAREIMFNVYHDGVVYFVTDCGNDIKKKNQFYRPYVVTYDLKNFTSRILKMPRDARRGSHDISCKFGIFKWGNITSSFKSICLIRLRKFRFTTWVLIDYNLGLWKRVMKIRIKAIMGLEEYKNSRIAGFTLLNGDMLVFATDEKIYRYNLLGKDGFETSEQVCEHKCGFEVDLFSYSNTLRPCGNGATSLSELDTFRFVCKNNNSFGQVW